MPACCSFQDSLYAIESPPGKTYSLFLSKVSLCFEFNSGVHSAGNNLKTEIMLWLLQYCPEKIINNSSTNCFIIVTVDVLTLSKW